MKQFPPHIESKFIALAKKKNFSGIQSISVREVITILAQIKADAIKDKIREQQLNKAA